MMEELKPSLNLEPEQSPLPSPPIVSSIALDHMY